MPDSLDHDDQGDTVFGRTQKIQRAGSALRFGGSLACLRPLTEDGYALSSERRLSTGGPPA
ncbi:hypothetical protein Kfla_6623 [Kribbella flavida DSM 17836]|uniref:Uncharacterized protein n=1 Tax=Kribbella flavida (strain DSM 17836 / JCM 10339 / NBRC 14399) TaxID=479435 RepID=D2PZP9_KRIFD|nr:hypothetical protein [Kribbella flavida]ADB35615.1 hypothetical protein Kfla_6623 [Kribbella flavida DSM 17836]